MVIEIEQPREALDGKLYDVRGQREVSPELPSDLPGETKKKEKRQKGKTCPLRDLNLNF